VVAVVVARAALARGALVWRGGTTTISTGFVAIFHAVIVRGRQTLVRVAYVTSKGIAIVIALTALALFTLRRGGTTTINTGFVAIFHVVGVGWYLAHAARANDARAILSNEARQPIGACWRVKAATIHIGFVAIFFTVMRKG
jgi:hypothetical protein